jgi:hypothetical protein
MTIIERIKDTELRIKEEEVDFVKKYEWWQQQLQSARNQQEYKNSN